MSKQHKCKKQLDCVCEQITELTKLYEELRCLRKQAAIQGKNPTLNESSFEFHVNEIEAKEVEAMVCTACSTTLRHQRDKVRGYVAVLRELNERVAEQEEESCQLEKQVGFFINKL